jgi:glycosyltransferase involved in cell wall biosynthesis
VSVIMPVFDAGQDLAQAVDSIAAQTYADRELVIVDDGSTDPVTLRLLDEVVRRPGVSVHRQANGGPSRARNAAILRARGAYVLPLDADDWLAPEYLARTVPVLEAEPDVGVVHTWIGLVGGHSGTWKTGEFSLEALLSRCTVHVCSLYRRAVWEAVGGYDPRFVESWEDWDFWLGAAERGVRGRCVPEVLAYYRRTARSRERKARAPGVGGRLMRQLVDKHHDAFAAHLGDAMAGLYEELAATSLALERVYAHPVMRVALGVRRVLGGARRS